MSAAGMVSWGAVAVLVYAYFGYPLLLWALAWLRRSAGPPVGDERPHVTVVVAAWNEEGVIGEKIENTLGLNYPAELLDLIVVSDESTDRTDEIVSEYRERTGRVRLLRLGGRQGKSAALNVGVPAARGEVVVLTDANAMFEAEAIGRLVCWFGDPRVGAVSGELRYRTSGGVGEGESVYWRYEQGVKKAESAQHSLLGANGSIYAIRRDLYRAVHPRDVNDFRIPYEILLRGYWVVLEPEAVSFENPAPSLWAEYRRKVRIMARAIPMMISLLGPTLVRGRVFALWQLMSHKLLREVQGVFFLAAAGGAAWGAVQGEALAAGFLAAQVGLYLCGAVGWVVPAAGRWRPLRLAAHFDMIVLASTAALALWLTGRIKPTWQPARRTG